MNTCSSISYNNKPAFTGFLKPKKDVLNHFGEVILNLNPDGRQQFVSRMEKIVNDAKDCPVHIEHGLVSAYNKIYVPTVRGTQITTKKNHNNPAEQILDVMQKASDYAKNLADADVNYTKIYKIFDIQC